MQVKNNRVEHTISKQTTWMLIFLGCATFMVNMDMLSVNLILPALSKDFHAGLNDLQWVLSAYVLFSATFGIITTLSL